MNWTVDEVAGYLRSWSATQRFIGDRGFDPVPDLIARAAPHWGEPGAVRRIRWPLTVRAGRVG
ncbi:MAG: hypothetical protein M5R36_02770 [Deltaproteobacteria bacterium]|nr:hypothetical protein [Deltaproteobacteria bacterium]